MDSFQMVRKVSEKLIDECQEEARNVVSSKIL